MNEIPVSAGDLLLWNIWFNSILSNNWFKRGTIVQNKYEPTDADCYGWLMPSRVLLLWSCCLEIEYGMYKRAVADSQHRIWSAPSRPSETLMLRFLFGIFRFVIPLFVIVIARTIIFDYGVFNKRERYLLRVCLFRKFDDWRLNFVLRRLNICF